MSCSFRLGLFGHGRTGAAVLKRFNLLLNNSFLFSLKQLSPSPETPTSQSHLSNSNYAISFQAFNRSFCAEAPCLWDPADDSVQNLKRELLQFFTFTSFSTMKRKSQTKAAGTNTSNEQERLDFVAQPYQEDRGRNNFNKNSEILFGFEGKNGVCDCGAEL